MFREAVTKAWKTFVNFAKVNIADRIERYQRNEWYTFVGFKHSPMIQTHIYT